MQRLASVFLTGAMLTACGDSATDPTPPTFESVAGTYAGDLAGQAQGIVLEAVFSFTFTQSDGDLSGSWSLSGTLNDGILIVNIVGSGALNGTITSGQNPSINVTATNACPGYEAAFSGSLDTANDLITLSGPIDILENCIVVLTYDSVILLRR